MTTRMETRPRSLTSRLFDVFCAFLALAALVFMLMVLVRAGMSVWAPEPVRPTIHTF